MKRLFPFFLCACTSACIGTETGNPPLEPELNPNLLSFSDDGAQVQVQGAAGAVVPGGAEVQLTPLDGNPAFRLVSEADGSFVVERPFALELRLQAIVGRRRSDIVDHRFPSDTLTAACRPTTDTDFVRVEGDAGEDAIGYVNVSWPCGNPPSASMLYGDQGISVTGVTGGVGVQTGRDELTLAITFDGRPGEVEDHIVVSMGSSPVFITVVAEACGSDCDL